MTYGSSPCFSANATIFSRVGGAVFGGPGKRIMAAFRGGLLLALLSTAALRGQTQTLETVTVSATRGAPPPDQMPVAVDEFSAERLASFPAITLDDALRDDASFSLFRRTSSLTSNPTSQGVSLRDIGPSGASRSLVLLDGIPLNDPFGGWVIWSQVPRLSLARADIIKGGGSGVWGNQALAGSIELIQASPAAGSGQAVIEAGAFGTRSAETAAAEPLGPGIISIDARDFSTDGAFDLAPSVRGAVDRPFNSDHKFGQVRIEEPLSANLEAVATGNLFAEDRGNGTILQKNVTHSGEGSFLLEGTPHPGFSWSGIGYAERESFSSFFTSVSANRATETPADNQFDVPATAAGAAVTADWSRDGISTVTGADFRQVVGETREDFQFSGGNFTRVRFAGGAQDFAGAFLHHDRPLSKNWRFSLDIRFDEWQNRQGHDREFNLADGAPTLSAAYPSRTGREFSPNIGLVWKPPGPWRMHVAAYRGFRLPTLNEYYRPFRVGTVTTDANPNLQVETLDGAELGFDYSTGPFRAGATVFGDEFYHSVGTVTLSQSPTSTTVQRQNIDAVQIPGLEASAGWTPAKLFGFHLGYLYNDSKITTANEELNLVGLRLPEVPRHTLTAEAEYSAPFAITAGARLRWVSMQFDDNANTLRLPAATIIDFELSRRLGRRLEITLTAENALNARVATSLSTAGLFTYDVPLLIRGGVRFKW